MDKLFVIKFCNRVNGEGLFSNGTYKKNDIIYTLTGPIKNTPDKYTIEIGVNKHITDLYGIYMNHSFTPSVSINKNNVVALQDINPGDEISFNYNENETKMACPFETPNGLVSGKQI